MRETQIQSLGWEDPLEKAMAPHSSTLAWRIPWMEEPGRLQSAGSQRVWHTERPHFHLIHWQCYKTFYWKDTQVTQKLLVVASEEETWVVGRQEEQRDFTIQAFVPIEFCIIWISYLFKYVKWIIFDYFNQKDRTLARTVFLQGDMDNNY